MTQAARIVVADDHAVVRSGLCMLLDAEEDLEVVGEAGAADEVRERVVAHTPDVLLLDLHMPGGNTLALIPELAGKTAVIVLTMQDDPGYAREAIRAGARGYVLKEADDAELLQAVRVVADGGTYVHPALGARLAGDFAGDSAATLTGREREVLRLLALGHTNAEIAEQLYLSVRTVETHRSNIQGKLDAHSRAELVRHALELRLVNP